MVSYESRKEESGIHTKTGGQDNGDNRSQFHRETAGRRHQRNSVTQVSHDVVAISPETDDDAGTTKAENPDGDFRLLTRNKTGVPDLVDGGIGTDGIGNIVCSVNKRGGSGSHDLEEGVEVLGLVVKVCSTSVDLLNITSNNRLFGLRADNVLVDTVENGKLDSPPHESTSVPFGIGLGADHGLVSSGGRVNLLRGGVDDLLLVLSFDITIVGISSVLGAAGIELLTSQVTLVEVADGALEVGGRGRDRTTAEEERALDQVVSLDLPILLDDDAVEPRDEEDGHEETPSGTSSDDDTGDLGLGEVDLVAATLPDEKHDDEGSSEPEVEGNEDETLHGWVSSEEDAILGGEEENRGKDTREHRSNDPSQEDLNHTLLDIE